jgi:serine protease AprX
LRAEKIISSHYKHVDGTSFAAPIVCSIIAQMLEANQTLKPLEIKEIILESAQLLANFPHDRQGYGVVQAKEAIVQAEDLFQYSE